RLHAAGEELRGAVLVVPEMCVGAADDQPARPRHRRHGERIARGAGAGEEHLDIPLEYGAETLPDRGRQRVPAISWREPPIMPLQRRHYFGRGPGPIVAGEVHRPSISRKFCTAAPEAPLPRLSSRATSTACRCASLANTLSSMRSVSFSASGSSRPLLSAASSIGTTEISSASEK